MHVGQQSGGFEVHHKAEQQQQLNAELDHAGRYGGEWADESGEVYLAEYAGVGDKGIAGAGECLGEEVPDGDAAHVEHHLGGSVGGQLGDVPEDEHVGQGGEYGVDEVPEGAEDGLFVLGYEIALDEEQEQVAVPPHFAQLQVEQAVFRADDEVPVFFGLVLHLIGGVDHHAICQIVERVDGKHGYGKIEA